MTGLQSPPGTPNRMIQRTTARTPSGLARISTVDSFSDAKDKANRIYQEVNKTERAEESRNIDKLLNGKNEEK